MRAQIGRFPGVASILVLPDRRSWAVCGGRFSAASQESGFRPAQRSIQYRRVTTGTGELDGATDTDGG